jgi:hypothetical protein
MSYLEGTRNPRNIVPIQSFVAEPDVDIYINLNDVFLLMPIFKWDEVNSHYIDATGDYDLCMSEDGLKFKFINRRKTVLKFAYRFIPGYWLAKRVNVSGQRH